MKAGAALLACHKETGVRPSKLRSLSLGFEEEPKDIKNLLKNKDASEDETKNFEKKIQKLTDDNIVVIEKIVVDKEKEIY